MIIVSQNRETIVNFNNIVYIDIEKNTFGKYFISAYFDKEDSDFVWLGVYETKERAKEVLEEIIGMYEHTKHRFAYENIVLFGNKNKDNVYYMPEV